MTLPTICVLCHRPMAERGDENLNRSVCTSCIPLDEIDLDREHERRVGITLTEALNELTSYALTARETNTKEWMRGLVERCNGACVALGCKDRFKFVRDCIERENR